jgi:hypothetical protein
MPNDFISREAAKNILYEIQDMTIDQKPAILQKIDRIPAADVVPVVRCGECIHRVNMVDNKEICCGRMAMRVMALDDYCSHGVRIDGGEHHAE